MTPVITVLFKKIKTKKILVKQIQNFREEFFNPEMHLIFIFICFVVKFEMDILEKYSCVFTSRLFFGCDGNYVFQKEQNVNYY